MHLVTIVYDRCVPRLLDLFCGAGGAAMGYHRAGFEVVGVDIKPQRHYPFEFHQDDALFWLKDLAGSEFSVHLPHFDAIHASPPCQGYSRMRHLKWVKAKDHPLLIDPVRDLLEKTGLPWVIENVEDAPMPSAITLCAQMFGLPMYRHRRFESNYLLMQPPHPRHEGVIQPGPMLGDRMHSPVIGIYGHPGGDGHSTLAQWKEAMEIDWMSSRELAQAIPPAYTEFIGTQLLESIGD